MPNKRLPEFTGILPSPSILATALPLTNASLVNAVAAMLGTESMVMFVSVSLKCHPSSVSADLVTSATGTGSAAATPQQTNRGVTTMTMVRKIVPTTPPHTCPIGRGDDIGSTWESPDRQAC